MEKPKAGEPAQWAKIAYPAGAHVWVHSSYVDDNKTVKPKKLNVRTGPGENYSIVGVIEHGTAVKEISAKGKWMEIEAPGLGVWLCRSELFAASTVGRHGAAGGCHCPAGAANHHHFRPAGPRSGRARPRP